MNIGMNQQQIVKKRAVINAALSAVFFALLAWVSVLFYQEIDKKNAYRNEIQAVIAVRIERQNNTVELQKIGDAWKITSPYREKASTTVVDAFLQRLNLDCQPIDTAQLSRDLEFYATVRTNRAQYAIGELNAATDRVYVKKTELSDGREQVSLCDKLVASIALAPAINFIDKQLYRGKLKALRGSFGSISNFSGIDLSVLELAPANAEQAREASISDLTFVSDEGETRYLVLPPTADGKHLMLFEPKKAVIYVIANNPKINAILGL